MFQWANLAALSSPIQLPANSSLVDRAPTVSWDNFGGSLTVNFLPGPDGQNGSQQAARLQEASGSSTCGRNGSAFFAGSTASWVIRSYVKPWGPIQRFISIGFQTAGAGTNFTISHFDMSTGLIGKTAAETGYATSRQDVKRLGNGWFRLSSYATLLAENVECYIILGDTVATVEAGTAYVGDGISSALIWGIDVRLATDATG